VKRNPFKRQIIYNYFDSMPHFQYVTFFWHFMREILSILTHFIWLTLENVNSWAGPFNCLSELQRNWTNNFTKFSIKSIRVWTDFEPSEHRFKQFNQLKTSLTHDRETANATFDYKSKFKEIMAYGRVCLASDRTEQNRESDTKKIIFELNFFRVVIRSDRCNIK